MRFLPLVLKHLRRSWIRSASTILALALCIFLFLTLQSFLAAVNRNLATANASRLVTRHAVSLVFNLPMSYHDRIAAIPGVKSVAMANWFGGSRKPGDFSEFFPNFAIEAEPYLDMYPEIGLTAEERRAFLDEPRGCIVGPDTAARFGWKVGDTFQLESFIPPYRAARPFEFLIKAIYHPDMAKYPGADNTLMFFHHKYLYETTNRRVGVGTYVTEVDNPDRAGEVSKAIDTLFANSDAETHTETEQAFRASFVALAGNLALLLNTIGMAVIFTILLVTANTMSMAVRERRNEMGVLKTLGFSSGRVMGLVLSEAGVIGLIGGVLGLVLSLGLIGLLPHLPVIGPFVRGLSGFGMPTALMAGGVGLALFIALAAGLIPSLLAYRARITDLLRQI
ncbi:MAG TPA: FtsX-like permease family protein [Candidatus Polarisedimenticolia bacterium]|nr:FtsX-like permease family protein [Candidatus Polarisedimenticolia bacterium]